MMTLMKARCEKLSIDKLDDILKRIGTIRSETKRGSAATYVVVKNREVLYQKR